MAMVGVDDSRTHSPSWLAWSEGGGHLELLYIHLMSAAPHLSNVHFGACDPISSNSGKLSQLQKNESSSSCSRSHGRFSVESAISLLLCSVIVQIFMNVRKLYRFCTRQNFDYFFSRILSANLQLLEGFSVTFVHSHCISDHF